ncbi:unnamed protein product [Prorocentrum cordatum]|uniref:Reverse transcriptase domain-containing protein n=1 Tax=Prorocentrum cordatum TaxID=2364126 RepID=A0ABN9UT74_9DINO|nr:unnamed protein product [Polarella glacialis]
MEGIGAFGLLRRHEMLEGLANLDRGSALPPVCRLFTGERSQHRWHDDAGQGRAIDQAEGGREQGDPLMPALFALGLHPALQQVRGMPRLENRTVASLDGAIVATTPDGEHFEGILAEHRRLLERLPHLGDLQSSWLQLSLRANPRANFFLKVLDPEERGQDCAGGLAGSMGNLLTDAPRALPPANGPDLQGAERAGLSPAAACPRARVFKTRSTHLEKAAARICRGAGGRVAKNQLLRDLNGDSSGLGDLRQLEVIANGTPLRGGAQLAIDATLASPVRADGTAQPRAADEDGVQLAVARGRKEATHPELLGSRRCPRVVLGLEVRGWWSDEALRPAACQDQGPQLAAAPPSVFAGAAPALLDWHFLIMVFDRVLKFLRDDCVQPLRPAEVLAPVAPNCSGGRRPPPAARTVE